MNDHLIAARKLLHRVYELASEQIEINVLANYSQDDVAQLNEEALNIHTELEAGIAQLNSDFNDPIMESSEPAQHKGD